MCDFSTTSCGPNRTAWEICRGDLMISYKLQPWQPLWEDGAARCCACAVEWSEYRALREDSQCVLNVTWFPDEPHFQLHRYVNTLNVRFWATENLTLAVANPLRPEGGFDVVCVVERWNIRSTVRRPYGHYWCLPQSRDEFIRFLMGYGMNCDEFSLVSRREWHTSHQQCRTSLPSWLLDDKILPNRYPALHEEGFRGHKRRRT
jgi:hypothetical protein